MNDKPQDSGQPSIDAASLRQRAEAQVRAIVSPALSAQSPQEIQQMLHELRVYQIELEMQNEELRTAQGVIEAVRARYFDLYDLAPVGYFIVSKAGVILEANLTAVRLLGTSRSALVKQPISRFILKQDQDIYYLHHKQFLATGEAQECELRMLKPDGAFFWAHLAGVAAQADDGAPVCHITCSDVSERMKVAAELEQHRRHLEEMVQARTAELSKACDDAKAANRAKSVFLSTMSHELRTPINGIMGMVHLALLRAEDPQQIDWLNKSQGAAKHLLAVINDILDSSKIDANQVTLEEQNFSLPDVIDDVMRAQDVLAQAKGLSLLWHVDPALSKRLSGDAMRLRQILLNFIGNAIKFSEHGEISVRASVAEEGSLGVLVKIEVTDQGIGISPDQQARLFHAFAQADGTMSRRYGGTGLGLVITRGIARLMGGDTGVTSREGSGSTFWATLRLKWAAQVAPMLASDTAETAREALARLFAGTRVLVAEDDPGSLEVLTFLLQAAGLAPEIATDGQQAVDMARGGGYGLILMDVQMPVMNGLDATRAIRQLPGMSKILILAMTANAFDEDRRACLAAGMDAHVGKPTEPGVLFEVILHWLRASAAEVPV